MRRDGLRDCRDTTGNVVAWLLNGGQIMQARGFGTVPTTWSIVGQRDFNSDGKYDWLWSDTSGNTAIWFMNGLQIKWTAGLGNISTAWTIQGANAD